MDKLSELEVFTRVVDAGSFTGAARSLRLSKSAVSKHVTRLEDRLGVRLLNRTTRRLSLTEVGQAFYERCKGILTDLEEAEAAASHLSEAPRGVLRIAAPMSFGIKHVVPLLPRFQEKHPDLKVDMNLNDRVVDIVEEGFDMAIRITKLQDSSLIARKLASSRLVVAASPDYWNKKGRPQRPEDLKNHDCLIYSYAKTPNEWEFQKGGQAEAVRIDGPLTVNNGDACWQVACQGFGVARGPLFLLDSDVRSGSLELALEEYEPDSIDIYAVYPHARHLSPKVRAFVDFLVASFRAKKWC